MAGFRRTRPHPSVDTRFHLVSRTLCRPDPCKQCSREGLIQLPLLFGNSGPVNAPRPCWTINRSAVRLGPRDPPPPTEPDCGRALGGTPPLATGKPERTVPECAGVGLGVRARQLAGPAAHAAFENPAPAEPGAPITPTRNVHRPRGRRPQPSWRVPQLQGRTSRQRPTGGRGVDWGGPLPSSQVHGQADARLRARLRNTVRGSPRPRFNSDIILACRPVALSIRA